MKKNILALTLGAAMVAGAMLPAFADGEEPAAEAPITSLDDVVASYVDDNGNSIEKVQYEELEDNFSGESETSVYAVIGTSYKVTIPKVIVLKGAPRGQASTATYYVDVDGDIAGDQKVVVAPAAEFAMKQAGKADVTATVAQGVTEFLAGNTTVTPATNQAALGEDTDACANADTEASGTVSANLTAGKWQGAFNFEISLVDFE